jgi:hypothetical protein
MRHLFTLGLLIMATIAWGQPTGILGRVLDAETEEPLPGANVVLQAAETGEEQITSTNERGGFIFPNPLPGTNVLTVSFIGYQTFVDTLQYQNEAIRQRIRLVPGIELEGVEVEGRIPMGSQRGDTTQYNAEAFKVNPNATAEDLIRKMPGVVRENGQVQAQGEQVQEVLVDGKPFFGNDPNAALRNLPAEVIDKIQVFDQQSEQSQFTGFEDGQTTKTINIITKKDKRNGQFGNLYAGYGYEDRYTAGGNVNVFNGAQRFSVIGLANNINQQNFSSEDLIGMLGENSQRRGRRGRRGGGGSSVNDFLVDQQEGIITTNAIGVNYSDQWGQKVEVSGSYFFNWSDNQAATFLNQLYLTDNQEGQIYEEQSQVQNLNINHRANLRLEYKITEKTSLLWRPRLSFQENRGMEETQGRLTFGDAFLSSTSYQFEPDLTAFDLRNDLLVRHRFAKSRRTLSLSVRNGWEGNGGLSELISINSFSTFADSLQQQANLDTRNGSLSGNLSYTEPLGEKGMLQFTYLAGWQDDGTEREVFDFDLGSGRYDQLNTALSNSFESDLLTQRLGAGYRLRDGKNSWMISLDGQWAQLESRQLSPGSSALTRDFYNLLPRAMWRYEINEQSNLRVFYRSSTDAPSVEQLQNVVDNSNPLQLTSGNPALDQSVQHRLFTRYSMTNPESSSVFYALLGGSTVNNFIGSQTILARADTVLAGGVVLPAGAQVSFPVNISGYWDMRSFFTYGVPVAKLKSNLSFNFSGNYQRRPGILNGRRNEANNVTLGLGVTLASNISERVDFTVSTQTTLNQVRNTLPMAQDNEYLGQRTGLIANLIFGKGWTLRTDLNHQFYAGLSDELIDNFLLWNASLGKQFLEDDRGEIRISAFDLLAQNVSVQRNVTDVFVEDVQTEVLQRYVMLSFVYRIRNFGSGKGQRGGSTRPSTRPSN